VIDANLREVQDQIGQAASSAGRDPGEVTLVVVTKTFPTSDIRLLRELGVRHVGENRHPEAAGKAAELADLDLVWHFVGQLQSNKAARIASYADVVHSVDSLRAARRLGVGAHSSGRVVTCLVQVSLDPPGADAGRAGVAESELAVLADAVEATDGLRLGGVMGVAPPGQPAAEAFARLAELGRQIRLEHPGATAMSAGMSGDFPQAIRAGATHVRVGSAILGSRPPLR
jgi:pyridoxal phosphate enzyme (YggS family)